MTALLAALSLSAALVLPAQNRGAAPAATQANPAAGQSGTAQRTPPIQDVGDYYLVNFDETGGDESLNLEAFVKICQEATGINFTYAKETEAPLRQAKLRMFGPKRIPKADFYNFFQIMMIINDFVCTKIGPEHLSVVVISPLSGASGRPTLRGEAVYVEPDELERYEDQPAILITTVVDLPSTDVRTLSNSMRSMFQDANTQQIIPVGNTNSLIITGFGSNVAAIVKMLKFVDDAAHSVNQIVPQFEVIKLEYASPEDIAETLSELLEASRRALQSRGQQQAAQGVTSQIPGGQNEAKILVEPRTRSLLVMAMPDDLPRIKELVARLDVEIIEHERDFHIYALDNADAEELAETLDNFIRDAGRITQGAAGANRGGAAQAATPSPTGGGRTDIVIVPDKPTNSLLIAAGRSRYEEVLDLVRRLDIRQPQVLIETALVELSGRNFLDIGVELGGADLPGEGTGSFGVTSFGMSTFADSDEDGIPDVRVPGLAQGITAGILDGSDFSMPILIAALKTRRDTNVLNVPSVLVNNNGSAKVTSKDQQPTTTITANGGSGIGGQTQESFNQYVEAGITMQISPTISASRYLRLRVSLEVSTFLGTVSGSIPPPKITRTIETTVNVPDGDTMVIGGIITDNKGHTRQGIPFLSDLPILGYLFRRDSDSLDRTTLYFFVTPHIMQDKDFADLAEVSYQKKLDAADSIGADRIRVIDPRFGKDARGVDLRGFEVPLYRSPVRGEVEGDAVGIDSARANELLQQKEAEQQKPAPAPTPDDSTTEEPK
ncbi:MAG: secretin N-terminal domain-containing protein [Planctomycetota bacterium]